MLPTKWWQETYSVMWYPEMQFVFILSVWYNIYFSIFHDIFIACMIKEVQNNSFSRIVIP